ncbi:MAG: OmpA family protein [Bacteroidota bacterium]|nr:OmpA family protein [Bacteroidota bacterium]
MKKKNVIIAQFLAIAIIFSSCSSMSNTGKGALIGGGGGAALGAGIGALAGKGKGALIGAAIGGAVGAGAGALIGKKMDKQKAELEKVQGAKVETVTDANNLQAIRVTFDSGILFATGKSALSQASKTALTNFATSLKNTPETDVTIYGHTDNTGSDAVNQKLSEDRAQAVANFITNNGVASSRLTTKGMSSSQPVADNSTAAGRTQNRRVEVYITANKTMIQQAENGTLK